MKLKDLRNELDKIKIHPSKYKIDGTRKEDTLCLIFDGISWKIIFVERGYDFVKSSYTSEDEACNHFLDIFSEKKNNYRLVDGWYR